MSKKIIVILIVICFLTMFFGLFWLGSRQKVNPLCADFELVENEVSCDEAINLALAEYPGEVESIKKDEIKTSPEQEIFANIWLVKVKLDNPVESSGLRNKTNQIIVSIDRYTKEDKIYGYIMGRAKSKEQLPADSLLEELSEEIISQLKQKEKK